MGVSLRAAQQVLQVQPRFSAELRKWNLRAVRSAVCFMGVMVLNFGLSAMQVLFFRHGGVNSVTALVSNTLLLAFVVLNNANIAYRCWHGDSKATAVSLYTQKLINFNSLDNKFESQLGKGAELHKPHTHNVVLEPISS